MLPTKDHRYLEERGLAFDEIVEGGQRGVVLCEFSLPQAQFNTKTADILIILPSGYPDVPPDMFFTIPWLRLESSGNYPRKADSFLDFGGRKWQRWSRHNNEWRQGTDGIWTMIKRVDAALQRAA